MIPTVGSPNTHARNHRVPWSPRATARNTTHLATLTGIGWVRLENITPSSLRICPRKPVFRCAPCLSTSSGPGVRPSFMALLLSRSDLRPDCSRGRRAPHRAHCVWSRPPEGLLPTWWHAGATRFVSKSGACKRPVLDPNRPHVSSNKLRKLASREDGLMGEVETKLVPGASGSDGPEGLYLGDAIHFFLSAKRAGGRSERTIDDYRKKLELFQRWLAGRLGGQDAVDAPYIDIGADEVEAYVVYLKDERGMADSSRKNHLAVLRSFFQTVSRRMKLPDPTTDLDEVRFHQKAPKRSYLTKREADILLS